MQLSVAHSSCRHDVGVLGQHQRQRPHQTPQYHDCGASCRTSSHRTSAQQANRPKSRPCQASGFRIPCRIRTLRLMLLRIGPIRLRLLQPSPSVVWKACTDGQQGRHQARPVRVRYESHFRSCTETPKTVGKGDSSKKVEDKIGRFSRAGPHARGR